MNVLVRMRKSHALRFVPAWNWCAGAHRLDEGVLDEVLGLGRVARQLARDAVHGVQVGERFLGERVGFEGSKAREGSGDHGALLSVPLRFEHARGERLFP